MTKTLRDYLPDNVQGKVFRDERGSYLVWRIACNIDNLLRTDRNSLPPEMSVSCFYDFGAGRMMKVEPHLDDPLVSETTPENYVQAVADSNRTFKPDVVEIEKVRQILERKRAS